MLDQIFHVGDLVALTGWLALVVALFAPPVRRAAQLYAGLAIPVLLACAYVALLATARGAHGGFDSIAHVRALFSTDAPLTAGWFHYLAFDLFVGAWIVREGLARGVWAIALLPCLVLTFLVGPAGFLLFQLLRLVVRPRAARA